MRISGKERFFQGVRIAAIGLAFLMLVAVILDIWLDADTGTWNWFVLDLLGLPLCGLLLWELLRCRDIRRGHMRQIPVVLLFTLFGGYASYLSFPLLAVLALPALVMKPPVLPVREERTEAPRMAWLTLLVSAVILYNCETLMHIMGFRWTLQDGLAEVGTLIYPAAIILLCVTPLSGRLRDDWKAMRVNSEAYAHRSVPVAALAVGLFLILRRVSGNTVDLSSVVDHRYQVALPLTMISGVLMQPASEELIYRGVLRRVIRNRWVFLAAGAVLYGLVRTLTQTDGILVPMDVLAYSVLGLGFCTCYALTDNFFVSYFVNAFISLAAVLAGLPMFQT